MNREWTCEECGECKATFHFTEIVDGAKREFHLCENCARGKTTQVPAVPSLTEVLDNLLKQVSAKEYGETAKLTCPTCGITYAEFRATGRFGCPNDYEVFHKSLTGLLEQIQMDTRHVGKVPPDAGDELARENELLRLRRELERAAQREEFEKAAELRDRIAELSRSIRGNK